jgi:hypothetical protein
MLRLRDLLQTDPNNINGRGIPTELFERAISYCQEDWDYNDLVRNSFYAKETEEGSDYWKIVADGNIVFVDGNWKVLGFEYPWDKMTKEDSIVNSVVEKFQERSRAGVEKYNKTLDRNDLCLVEWLNHLQEELMDATLYVQKLKEEV